MENMDRSIELAGGPTRNLVHVRFGSEADICGATTHVRFAPNSDRESGLPPKVMSAIPPKADMCDATRDVRYGPKADITSGLVDYFIGAAE